jgi:hypothetical protein
VLVTAAVYTLILPLILLVPKELIATADGEPNPQVEGETLAEIGDERARLSSKETLKNWP